MKKPSESEQNWDDLRQQIIGLGEGSHKKNYYPALKQSRDALIRFRAVMEEIPDLILISDEAGQILDLNREAEKAFSRSRSEIINSTVEDLLGGHFESLKERAEDESRIIEIIETTGEVVYRELVVKPVKLGQKPLCVVIGRNVSHRMKVENELRLLNENLEEIVKQRTASIEEQMTLLKETQQQLILSEKMAVLGNMVAGVAHEINNPLGIGVTASSALVSKASTVLKAVKANELTEPDFHDFLEYLILSTELIQTNLERAGELVKSFKQVAVDQSSELSRKILFVDYVEEVVQSLYPQWKKHSVHIEGDEEIEIDTVPGDWSQVLTNLILNSVFHGFAELKSGGHVDIRISLEEGQLLLEYKDDGVGLTSDQADQIFDPFFTTARERGGTGLGMHIVYNIITLRMGGSISYIKSEEKGAMFLVKVPL